MSSFRTKAGRALEAAFAPEQRDAVTNPQAITKVRSDAKGDPVPVDRTKEGVVYQSDADEDLVRE